MSRIRRIFFALWMALAVVLGQQAVALHDLAHVAGHKQDSTPGKDTCDKCFTCAELAGAVGSDIPALPWISATCAPPTTVVVLAAPTPARFAYQAQAPPTSLS
jgi:hypothetical protein